jgi:hypothetical protein
VLQKGNAHGFKAIKSIGGQQPPIQIVGDRLTSKNELKKQKKNIASEPKKQMNP